MKENKFIIIICMLSCLVLACGVYIALDVVDNTEVVQNNTTENNTRESIKTAYECKPLESEAPDEYIYETNDITLKLFNNNKNEFSLLFKDGDYEVYKDNCGSGKGLETICKYSDKNKSRKYNSYYALNTKTNTFFNTFSEDWSTSYDKKYYFLLIDTSNGEDYNYPLLNIKNKNVIDGYSELSCTFHSDIQFDVCKKSETIIGTNLAKGTNTYADSTKYGLISLKDKSNILKVIYDYMSEDENGNFLVQKDNKMGLFSSTGTELLKLEYDYIGYNEYFGYITVTGEDLKVYDNNLKLRNVDEKSLGDTFTKILNAHNECVQSKIDTEAVNYLSLSNPDSYLWSAGSIIIKHDINNPYYDNFVDKENDSYRFKYTGKTYTGEKLIIYSIRGGCSGKPIMYVIEGSKAHKIDTKEISIKKDSEGNPAAFCF